MSRYPMGRAARIVSRFSLCLALAAGLALFAAVAQAQTEPEDAAGQGSAVTAEQLSDLVATLETPAERERFVAQLKALVAAQEAVADEKTGEEGASAIRALSDGLGRVGVEIVSIAKGFSGFPDAANWFASEWGDTERRATWIDVIWKLAAVVGGGVAAAYLVMFLLRRPRHLLEQRAKPKPWLRPPLLLSYNVLRVLPALAFAAAGYGLLTLLNPQEVTRLVALSAINAHVIASLVKAAANQGLAPWTPNLRLSGITDRTAVYCSIWWRRLVNITVYGYFACQAALLLGLPDFGYDALIRVLGIIVVGLLIALILQNRLPFGTWIRAAADKHQRRGVYVVSYRLADIWHILAIVYVVAGGMLSAAVGLSGFLYFVKSSAASIAIIWAAGFAMMGIRRAMERGFRLRPEVSARYPGMQERVNRYLPVLRQIIRVLLTLLAVALVLEAWEADALTWLATETGRAVIGRVAALLVIAVIAFIVWEIVSALIDRYLQATDSEGALVERSQRVCTLLPLARNVLRIVIGVVAIMMILAELGINIAPILAGVGVVGLAIGFGAQTLVKDVITGVFILLEDAVAVGDVVSVAGKSGLVEAITIRTIRLRDLTGNVHTIPFSAVDSVTNMTKEFSYYLIEAGVAYRENVDEVVDLLREVGADLQGDPEFGQFILEPIEILGLDRFDESAVVIRARIKTMPIKQWSVGREFNRRMKFAFDAHGIEIPFPHTTIYFGEDKTGKAPPMHVDLVGEDDRAATRSAREPGASRPGPRPGAGKSKAVGSDGDDDGGL